MSTSLKQNLELALDHYHSGNHYEVNKISKKYNLGKANGYRSQPRQNSSSNQKVTSRYTFKNDFSMLSNQGSDTSRSKSIPRLSEFSQFKERFSGPMIQDTEVKSKKNTPNINIIKKDANSVEYNYVNEDTENHDSNILNLNSSNF